MKQSPCDQLDGYMLGWLSPDETTVFERHLADCPECRRQQALQQSIDRILTGAEQSVDAIPQGLVDRAWQRVRTTERRKTLRRAVIFAAAAALLISVIIGKFPFWTSSHLPARDIAASQNTAATPGIAALNLPAGKSGNLKASARVAMADPSSGIVVERKPEILVSNWFGFIQSQNRL